MASALSPGMREPVPWCKVEANNNSVHNAIHKDSLVIFSYNVFLLIKVTQHENSTNLLIFHLSIS